MLSQVLIRVAISWALAVSMLNDFDLSRVPVFSFSNDPAANSTRVFFRYPKALQEVAESARAHSYYSRQQVYMLILAVIVLTVNVLAFEFGCAIVSKSVLGTL